MTESFESQQPIESFETEYSVLKKLDELGVDYKYKEKKGGSEYIFLNVKEAEHGAFWLDAGENKVLFQTFHFNKGSVETVVEEGEVAPETFFATIKEQHPDADEIIYSCCAPGDAREFFKNSPHRLLIVGSGSSDYKTVHNSKRNFITVSPK